MVSLDVPICDRASVADSTVLTSTPQSCGAQSNKRFFEAIIGNVGLVWLVVWLYPG